MKRIVVGMAALIAGCTGSGIGSKVAEVEKYYGCYSIAGLQVLELDSKRITSVQTGKYIAVKDFLKIRSSNFVRTINQIVVLDNAVAIFTERDTGFHYEFERGEMPPVLIITNGNGGVARLVKSGRNCRKA